MAEKRKAQRFKGLSQAEVMALKIPPRRELVADIVGAGTVGAIAGIPETHKSSLAVDIASKVSGLGGYVLGRRVLKAGPGGRQTSSDQPCR